MRFLRQHILRAMSDILDYILSRLADQPNAPPERLIAEARKRYGGDMVYIRVCREREVMGTSQEVARRHNVSRRTAQRWMRR
jgi:hypothetical protein